MTASVPLAPEEAPPALRDTRRELADEFLRGSGIEIGALHLAMPMPEGALVRYVDRMTVADLRAHYPELRELDLAPVDVVDDGELLTTLAAESVDFIIANHFLEHCEDPIRTIETHLGKLRPGGVLFYAVPDKRYTFDFRRPRTPLSHVVADHQHGPELSRREHYLEWQRLVTEAHLDPEDPGLVARAHAVQDEGYSIHFHVWTQADLVELMLHCHERFQTFEIEAVRRRSLENIVVLRKHDKPADWRPPAPPAPPASAPPHPEPERPSEEVRAELAALLHRLEVRVLLEIGCGDFAWAQEIASEVELYTGVDRDFDAILCDRMSHGGPRRRFLVRNAARDPLPGADLVLWRGERGGLAKPDVDATAAAILRTRGRYLLAAPGLSAALPPPSEVIAGGELALWDLTEIRGGDLGRLGPASGGNGGSSEVARSAEHEVDGDRRPS